LIAALAWSGPGLPVSAPVIATHAFSDIVCSGDGFGPTHGGIWLARKTLQTHTNDPHITAAFTRASYAFDTNPLPRISRTPLHILSTLQRVFPANFFARCITATKERAPPA
ncbi:hypothetical protein N8762_00875, partial [Candidatus Marinamargulisbacteria bacterium]|nr:hypothetical protein [Candidatus Marinamargulisbacteria bacterium]